MIYPIDPKQPAGKSDTAFWEDFLSEDEINKILSLPNWFETKDAEVGNSGVGNVNPEIRISQVSWMSVDKETSDIWGKLSTVVSEVNRTWFHYDITGFYEPAQLTTYTGTNQSYYGWHVDNSVSELGVPRKLSMSLLLDDPSNFEGGELQVKTSSDVPQVLEQKRGRAWFFPSYALHQVTPVTRGTRRSLVLWVGGPAFK